MVNKCDFLETGLVLYVCVLSWFPYLMASKAFISAVMNISEYHLDRISSAAQWREYWLASCHAAHLRQVQPPADVGEQCELNQPGTRVDTVRVHDGSSLMKTTSRVAVTWGKYYTAKQDVYHDYLRHSRCTLRLVQSDYCKRQHLLVFLPCGFATFI